MFLQPHEPVEFEEANCDDLVDFGKKDVIID